MSVFRSCFTSTNKLCSMGSERILAVILLVNWIDDEWNAMDGNISISSHSIGQSFLYKLSACIIVIIGSSSSNYILYVLLICMLVIISSSK